MEAIGNPTKDKDDADLNTFDDPLNTSDRAPLTGTIGSSSSSAGAPTPGSSSWQSRIQGQGSSLVPGEDRRAPTNTIDETVWETLRRDLLAVWTKMREVLWPRHIFSSFQTTSLQGVYSNLRSGNLNARDIAGRVMDAEALLDRDNLPPGIRDWDLWGPLIFCLALSVLLSFAGRAEQRDVVFSGVFALVWIGEAVVTLQIRLLGGNISFAQSICVIGYTLFPLVIAALLSALNLPQIARIPVYLVLVAWSLAAGVSILGGSGVVKNRVGLAVYPLFVFYMALGILCFIS